jgi:hypothetical protein
LNIQNIDIQSRKSTMSFQKRRTEFRTKVNLNKKQCISVMLPLAEDVHFYVFLSECNGHSEGKSL